jgi:fructose-bisphosphate aldolase class I
MELDEEVTAQTLEIVFERLVQHRILLEGMLLKPNMVVPGKKSGQKVTPAEIAEATLRTFRRVVPAAVPGIVFLSGGQSPEEATLNLNAINAVGNLPWAVSFSYGRALQEPSMEAWGGKAANVRVGQRLFYHRALCNSAATSGHYSPQMDTTMT